MNRTRQLVLLLSGLLAWGARPDHGVKAADPTSPPELPVLNWQPRSDWISVKDKGAVGDGKTDDTDAIQSAFDLIKRGVTVHFPPGVYRVRRTLSINSPNKRALYGVLVVGHGRATRLVWDGQVGGTLLQAEGMGYSRWVGIELDGAGKAAIGHHHFSNHTFETVHRKQHMAFRHFSQAGVYAEPTQDRFAMAETSFENCLFDSCGAGVSFTQFNDYNITFDGCEFRRCGIGIRCIHGNFYARNCHFEGSGTTDIHASPEHGSSVRRCTSLSSKMFVRYANPVAVMTIEGCTVSGWKKRDGAVWLSGAPVMIFDCTFTDPPRGGRCAVHIHSHHQRLISSQNRTSGGLPLFNQESRKRGNVRIYDVPAGQRKGAALSARQQFLKPNVRIPGKVFDAKRDFGAKGDGRTDDTAAIQKAIDAARRHGRGASAYLPAGRYVVKETLRLRGREYYVGGAGMLSTHLQWQGSEPGVTLAVEDPDHITVEHLDMQKRAGIDILQTGTGRPSRVTYDGLFVSRGNEPPFPGGIVCRGLDANATVLMRCVVGVQRYTDSSRATILVPLSYYGAIVVEGKHRQRDGLIGILSRFSGGPFNVVLRNNHGIVMSDYYSESSGNIFLLEGEPGDPPGQVTIQGAKLHLNEKRATHVIDIRNYAGQVFIGPDQFNARLSGRVAIMGPRPVEVFLLGNCFYHSLLQVRKHPAAHVHLLGNLPVAVKEIPADRVRATFADSLPRDKLPLLSPALDDLRRLGEVDLRLNHPGVIR